MNFPAGTQASCIGGNLVLIRPGGAPHHVPGVARKRAGLRMMQNTHVWLLDANDMPLVYLVTTDHEFVEKLSCQASLTFTLESDFHKLSAAFELQKRPVDAAAMEAAMMAPAHNYTAQMQAAQLDEIKEHKGKKWGEQLRYKTDDRDQDSHELCVMQGGNGDWYLSVAEGPDHHPVHGVRICTSGGAAAACPGLGKAVSDLYRALWRSYVQS